jgi:hypothetical protein
LTGPGKRRHPIESGFAFRRDRNTYRGAVKTIRTPWNIVLCCSHCATEAIGGYFGRRTGRNSAGNYSGPLRIYSAKLF